MSRNQNLHLFEAFGIELEYMIVGRDRLDVLPVADRILRTVAGKQVDEVERGALAWSNELALHIIELKTNGPVAGIDGLSHLFAEGIGEINRLLGGIGGRLLPGAMHPWMDPARETKIWPHGYRAVYEAYDRIFTCQGHGWSNLQSVHLNIGFSGDEEFGRLHAAIRLLLPILPALAASSPIMEGKATGCMDNRLQVYRNNQRRVPSVAGRVIPEAVFTKRDYDQQIFQPIYSEIAPYDPEGILRFEWLNSRGAIARFERNAIEIRLLDIQECPQADLAVCAAIIGSLKMLINGRWSSFEEQKTWDRERLIPIFDLCVAEADNAVIADSRYLRALGLDRTTATGQELWRHLIESCLADSLIAAEHMETLETILDQGSLARRLLAAVERDFSPKNLQTVYLRLADCLQDNCLFLSRDH